MLLRDPFPEGHERPDLTLIHRRPDAPLRISPPHIMPCIQKRRSIFPVAEVRPVSFNPKLGFSG
jgi:hypothetical protein